MHRTTKTIREEIDAAELSRQSSVLVAKNLYAKAVGENRQLNTAEQGEFDNAESVANEAKQQLASLRTELTQAESRERQLLMSRNPSGTVYNPTNSGRPTLVLPTNGVLPDSEGKRYGRHYSIGKLRAFKDEQTAFDSGMWLKAVVSRTVLGTIDARAEQYCESIGRESQMLAANRQVRLAAI
jgi:hypothetical protein